MIKNPVRIVILGGGFGGLATARALERQLPRDADVEVTLVNRDNYFLFTPMLHEVAASDLDVTTIVNPLRKMLKRTSIFTGTVDRIDTEARTVAVSHAGGVHGHLLAYDHLVVALGSVTNHFGIPGVAERALSMKSLDDAMRLRNRLIEHLEEADFECNASLRQSLLTFVVAGGGFAGVETVAAIHDFAHHAVKFYRNLRHDDIRVVVVHPGDYLLPELGADLGHYTGRRLAARGVEVILNAKVASVADDVVQLTNGVRIPAQTVVWTAGVSSNALVSALPCRLVKGRLATDECLRVEGMPNVWALGDCAHVIDRVTGAPYPPTAQHAIRQGACLAANIVALLRGEALRPFTFSTRGLLASIGHRTGVANIMGMNFSGFIAWWLWRTIYLAKLPRLEKKVRVALDWTLDVFFSKDLVQTGSSAARDAADERAVTTEPLLQFMAQVGEPPAASPAPADVPVVAAAV
jgi:NADH dehydrogenase